MSTLDADALATLTPEEREAVESNDMTPEELAAMQKIAAAGDGGDANDDDDEDDDDDDGDASSSAAAPIEGRGASDAAPADAAPAKAASADTAPAAAEAPAAQPRQATPRYEAPLPADYDTKVQELAEREADLKRKFRSGEMEFDDFETQRAELLTERESLTIARTKAEISQEMTAQSAQQAWQNTVDAFLTKAASEVNYRQDAEKMEDLDQFVKTLAAKATNADKSMEWFLEEAHRRVQALHGLSAPTARTEPAAGDKPGNQKPAATARRAPPVDAVPVTLANVPGGDGPGDVEGEFADIMALDGMAYETAIARMSPTQRERFLRAA